MVMVKTSRARVCVVAALVVFYTRAAVLFKQTLRRSEVGNNVLRWILRVAPVGVITESVIINFAGMLPASKQNAYVIFFPSCGFNHQNLPSQNGFT